MKYYGFSPYIEACYNNVQKEGLIYNLLNRQVLKLSSDLIRIFESNNYNSYDQILQKARKKGFTKQTLDSVLNEGIKANLIIELSKPYLRTPIKSFLGEQLDNSEDRRYPRNFQNITLQPTSKCNKNCKSCNTFINCSCIKGDHEWNKKECDNLIKDLSTVNMGIKKITIYGGNILEYKHLSYLLQSINTHLKPNKIQICINVLDIHDISCNTIKSLNQLYSNVLETVYLILPDNKLEPNDLLKLESQNYLFLIDQEKTNKIPSNFINSDNIKYLLKKDLSNKDWYKSKTNNLPIKGLTYYEFANIREWHHCWGFSIAIDSTGKIKPCLWSERELYKWNTGKVFEYLEENDDLLNFWLQNGLNSIPTCSDCIYKMSCKECRVISEFLTKKPNAKNPLCKIT